MYSISKYFFDMTSNHFTIWFPVFSASSRLCAAVNRYTDINYASWSMFDVLPQIFDEWIQFKCSLYIFVPVKCGIKEE